MKTFLILLSVTFISTNIIAADLAASVSTPAPDAVSVAEKANLEILSGRISDKLTGEMLVGVEVQLIGTDLKAYTDFDGNFEFKDVKPGAHAIKVEYISYRNVVENVHTGDSKKQLHIKLESALK